VSSNNRGRAALSQGLGLGVSRVGTGSLARVQLFEGWHAIELDGGSFPI
jgi:hypothetical protein